MSLLFSLFLLFCSVSFSFSESDKKKEKDSLLNYCIDGNNHKSEPGPEDNLHAQCTPWKKNSCCTGNTTVKAHGGNMYGFNYNHCKGRTMSKKCQEHFVQDLCFYECSPNVGPWMQKVDGMKMRRERYYEVPLCAVDCDDWFQACRNDYTCTDNWTRNFKWQNGTNQCPPQSQCRTFAEIYVNASNFCQTVWDDSWKYTPNNLPCMRMWFNGSEGNPNVAVARWKIEQDKNSGQNCPTSAILWLFFSVGVSRLSL